MRTNGWRSECHQYTGRVGRRCFTAGSLRTGGTGLRQFRQSEIQNLGRPAVECASFLGGHLGSSQRKGITGSACRWWSRGSTIAVLLDRSLCMRLAR